MKWYRIILPLALAVLTQHKREVISIDKIQWASNLWVYNIFRVYEIIFGRRHGIKHEMSKDIANNITYAHTWEAAFALIEYQIRELRHWRFPYRIYIPVLATPTGVLIPASPYLFAIAFDTSANFGTVTTNVSSSYTVTGSNPFLMASGLGKHGAAGSDVWPTNCTYNSVNMTKTDATTTYPGGGGAWLAAYYLFAPATGSNTFAITWTQSLQFAFPFCSSYSGTSQSGTLDSHNSASGTSAGTSWVASTTVVAASCWLWTNSDNDNDVTTLSIGTERQASGNHGAPNDSNATVGTGSQSITYTLASGTANYAWFMISIAPAASATVIPDITSDYIIYN